MIAVTEQWTGTLKPVFIAIPEVAPFYPRIEEDHVALIGARESGTAQAALRVLNGQADVLDTRHDHLQRALHFGMKSAREALLALAEPDVMLARAIEDASEALQPKGLEINNASYEGEAGNSVQMVQLAQTKYADVLSKVPMVHNLSALDIVAEIGKVGADLGGVERDKSLAVAAVEKEAMTPSAVRMRMRAWARTVELVLGALERSTVTPASIEKIRKPVEDAVEKARARRLAQQNAAEKKSSPPGDT